MKMCIRRGSAAWCGRRLVKGEATVDEGDISAADLSAICAECLAALLASRRRPNGRRTRRVNDGAAEAAAGPLRRRMSCASQKAFAQVEERMKRGRPWVPSPTFPQGAAMDVLWRLPLTDYKVRQLRAAIIERAAHGRLDITRPQRVLELELLGGAAAVEWAQESAG